MVEAMTAGTTPETAAAARTAALGGSVKQALGMEDFLQLLTAQISNQDPMEPMKDTEFIAQMANMASLEQMQQFTKGFGDFAATQREVAAQAYLGRQVTIENDSGTTVTGVAEAVERDEDDSLLVTVNGKRFPLADIVKVELAETDSSE